MRGSGLGGEVIGKGCGGWVWRGCEGKWIGRGGDGGKVRGREEEIHEKKEERQFYNSQRGV